MKVLPGFGSAGSSRSLRKTASAVGVGSTARERENRAQFSPPGRMDEPSREEILSEAEENACAWCMDGRAFRNLALHWQRGHGFDVHALRERLILPKQFRFASEELRDLKRRQGLEGKHAERLRNLPRNVGPRSLSTYAKQDNARKSKLVTREQRLAALAMVDRQKQAAIASAMWQEVPPEERRRLMSEIGREGAIALNELIGEHPEIREKALRIRKERHGY